MKSLYRIIGLTVILFIAAILFSLLFPGKVKSLDYTRLLIQKPLIKWAGNFRIEPGNREEVYISLEELTRYVKDLPAGSIFFTQTSNYPISGLIPGIWKHTGIFLGTREQVAGYFDTSGVLFKTLDTLMNTVDTYVLDSYSGGVSVRPVGVLSNLHHQSSLTHFSAFSFNGPDSIREKFISKALDYNGLEYDYDWIMEDTSAIFCSELLYHSLKAIDINIKFRTRAVTRDILTPDDLFRYLTLHSGKKRTFSFYGIFNKEIILTKP